MLTPPQATELYQLADSLRGTYVKAIEARLGPGFDEQIANEAAQHYLKADADLRRRLLELTYP